VGYEPGLEPEPEPEPEMRECSMVGTRPTRGFSACQHGQTEQLSGCGQAAASERVEKPRTTRRRMTLKQMGMDKQRRAWMLQEANTVRQADR
jgi:hypothetical protein